MFLPVVLSKDRLSLKFKTSMSQQYDLGSAVGYQEEDQAVRRQFALCKDKPLDPNPFDRCRGTRGTFSFMALELGPSIMTLPSSTVRFDYCISRIYTRIDPCFQMPLRVGYVFFDSNTSTRFSRHPIDKSWSPFPTYPVVLPFKG